MLQPKLGARYRSKNELEYYLNSFPGVVALDVAIRSGLIDTLAAGDRPAVAVPAVLLGLLQSIEVIGDDRMSLTTKFSQLWLNHAADLRSRVIFLRRAATDIAVHGEALLLDTSNFMQASHTFELFDYESALSVSASACERTKHWVDYLAALTHSEGPSVLDQLELPAAGHVLEVGGNAGAFARLILARHADLTASILDLPAVCEIGRLHAKMPQFGERLNFIAGDMRQFDWKNGFDHWPDVILFKSVLHDWHNDEVSKILSNAVTALAPQGRLIIVERGPYDCGIDTPNEFSDSANLVFSGFYRSPDLYADTLRSACPTADVSIKPFDLDMRWYVTMAQLP